MILSRKKQALPATYKIIPQFVLQCKIAQSKNAEYVMLIGCGNQTGVRNKNE